MKKQLKEAIQELENIKEKYEFNENDFNSQHQLLNDIKYIFLNEIHTDVVLHIGNGREILFAHRAILAG